MRIGIDASCWLNRRGFGRFTRELVRALLEVEQTNEYVLFLDTASARDAQDLPQSPRATVVTIDTGVAATKAAAADGSRSVSDLWRMRQAVKAWNGRLDVLYFPADYTYFPVSTTARVIVTKHDMTDRRVPELLFPTWQSRCLWEIKIRLAMRRADMVFTVSDTSRRDICRAFGLGAGQIRVISDAVDPSFTSAADDARRAAVLAHFGVAADERFLLYVGGISPHKNLATLVRAFQQWSDRHPDDRNVSLVLVGDFVSDVFHSSYQSVKSLIASAGLEQRVRFAGFVPDAELCDLYSAAEALVLPSFYEGFGLPALEAMACGTPVLASNAGSLPEVVGTAGLLFHPHSVDELAAAIERIVADSALRDDLSARGLVRASEFSWHESARAALAAFQDVMR